MHSHLVLGSSFTGSGSGAGGGSGAVSSASIAVTNIPERSTYAQMARGWVPG